MEDGPVVGLLRDAQLRLLSVAFHDEHDGNYIGGDVGVLAAMRRKDLGMAVNELESVLLHTPVEMRLGTQPVTVCDVASWEPVPDDDFEAVYGSDSLARAAFLACRKTLRPGEVLVIDSSTSLMLPGDPTPEVFMQNMGSGLSIAVESLAVALYQGARLALPNQI